ncbi:protein prune homolog 2-like isoform X2 [Artemia franciscana]|uniref:protein prune homolog 2-like isoform X2 n=1 Tax=Artemia franciscana TaxID=6661 RepID=UPI0032DB7F15
MSRSFLRIFTERTAQFTPRTQSTSNSPLHLTTYKCIDFEGKLAMHKKTRDIAPTLPPEDDEPKGDEEIDEDEEYYEDYTLPTTHQNVMSSRRSFRRKIQDEPAPYDPDADRIELVVKSGDLQRHNSIRRKIVPLPEDVTDVEMRPRLLQLQESGDEGNSESLTVEINRLEDMLNERPDSLKFEGSEHIFTPLEAETVTRIRECLNIERFKDLYQLGSRLQDLLTASEIEDIVNNEDKFCSVIDPEIVKILTESVGKFHESTKDKPKKKINPSDALSEKGSVLPPIKGKNEDDRDKCVIPDLISRNPLDLNSPGFASSHVQSGMPTNKIPLSRPKTLLTQRDPLHSAEYMERRDYNLGLPSRISSQDDVIASHSVNDSILERSIRPDVIPEAPYEEREDERKWRSVVISGLEKRLDVNVIEPYKKVLSHGGYARDNRQTAIIVFSACHLPDKSRRDYEYVMDNLFLYVLITLDALVAEDYILVYLHGATPRSCMPTMGWIRRCYQLVDRRLRKNLRTLYIVHPTIWLKTLVTLARPFVSSKFSKKLTFVADLVELEKYLPIDPLSIPDKVKQFDVVNKDLDEWA